MIKKVYGNHIITGTWSEGGDGLLNRTIEIYKLKSTFKVLIWDSGKDNWREEPNKPIEEFKDKSLGKILFDYHTKPDFEAFLNPDADYGTIKGDAEGVLNCLSAE